MYNKAILIGRLTADPELKQTYNGTSVLSCCIAVDRAYQSDGKRQTDFINLVAWRHATEFISKYFSKGQKIGVDGSIQTRSYEDREGNKRTAVEVVVSSAFFVSDNNVGNKTKTAPTTTQESSQDDFQEINTDDDLPF